MNVIRVSWILAAVLFLMPAHAAARRDAALKRFEYSEPHMGTMFRIVLYAPDTPAAGRASSAAFARITALDNTMSDYKPTSELMRLSASAGGPPVKVSADLYRVLEASERVAEQSDGAFDVTVGPEVRLWRRARRQHELPDPVRLTRARELVGYKLLRLDPGERTAQLLKPGMLLDLGGIAKGYAADEALAVLKRFGISRALVAAAGDIAVGSAPPGKPGWRIAIEALDPEQDAVHPRIRDSKSAIQNRYLVLHDAGVSTSGDAEQHVDLGRVRYSHIVDPKTGVALTGHQSVTVVARDDFAADGLATAVSVLGPERGLKLIEATKGAGVLFVKQTAAGVRSWQLRFR